MTGDHGLCFFGKVLYRDVKKRLYRRSGSIGQGIPFHLRLHRKMGQHAFRKNSHGNRTGEGLPNGIAHQMQVWQCAVKVAFQSTLCPIEHPFPVKGKTVALQVGFTKCHLCLFNHNAGVKDDGLPCKYGNGIGKVCNAIHLSSNGCLKRQGSNAALKLALYLQGSIGQFLHCEREGREVRYCCFKGCAACHCSNI